MSSAAQRYAEALLEAVWQDDESQRSALYEELDTLAKCIQDVPDLQNALQNPSYGKDERRKAFDAIADKLSLSERLKTFARLVIDRGRAGEFPEIAETFKRLYNQRVGRQQGTVYTAHELDDDAVTKIRTALEKKLGYELELSVQVDPSLIGGIKTQVGSLVFDGSLRSELARLRNQLANAS